MKRSRRGVRRIGTGGRRHCGRREDYARMVITYQRLKDFDRQLVALHARGGRPQKVANRLKVLIYDIEHGSELPFRTLSVTNNGESRIDHCVKYDLGDGYRLVTVQNERFVFLCFCGTHDETDRWLEGHKGLTPTIDTERRVEVTFRTPETADGTAARKGGTDLAPGPLAERLPPEQLDALTEGLSASVLTSLMKLESTSSPEDIWNATTRVGDQEQAHAIYDVLTALREGDLDEAVRRIQLFTGDAQPLLDLDDDEVVEVRDGTTVRVIRVGSDDYVRWIERFMQTASYEDWMLFLHPAQQAIVDEDFNGPAKLSGVSGSGKTCIVVKRAVRLAERTPGKPVLIVTLNRPLATLIRRLVDHVSPSEGVAQRIQVTSFFELCQRYLHRFEPENDRLYSDITWKLNEHIDEIWREYYRCWRNNDSAACLIGVHKSLNSRGVSPEAYIRQEFDWLRSAFGRERRSGYLDKSVERRGRGVPFDTPWRATVVSALDAWERKMRDVGVIDQLGLSVQLHRYVDRLEPEYAHVLVDEAQDFGTIELAILRRLAAPGENDLFLCGDLAQQVQAKHQSFRDAGIDIPGARSRKLERNYRNSREILRAAYEVFVGTLANDVQFDGELEIIEPEYANFSTPKPLVLQAASLQQEVACALAIAKDYIDEKPRKVCIAVAGFTLRDMQKFGERLGLPVLDGTRALGDGHIFLSDLEQTKGYEFDVMCILNCQDGVLPAADMPQEEQFRDACRFYVAMTRAKYQLVISHSGALTPWVAARQEHFVFDRWSEHVDLGGLVPGPVPEAQPQVDEEEKAAGTQPAGDPFAVSGRAFLYLPQSQGLSLEAQDKLDTLVEGRSRQRNSQHLAWRTVRDALEHLHVHPYVRNQFGPKVARELMDRYGDPRLRGEKAWKSNALASQSRVRSAGAINHGGSIDE